MSQQESLVWFAKDFFGNSTEARIFFYRNEKLIYSTHFENGYAVVKMPSQLEPGVYDVVARRDTGEYRINNMMIPMVSHYFSHSRLHDDLFLTGDNFKKGEVIEDWKFNPILYHYLRNLPQNSKNIFDELSKYSSNPDGMRWGGLISLEDDIKITRGAAVIGGHVVDWNNTSISIPFEKGTYNLGIKNNKILLTKENTDYTMAIIRKDHEDWIRMDVITKYHPIYLNDKSLIFSDFEEDTNDVEIDLPSQEMIFGAITNGKVFSKARSTVKSTNIQVKMIGKGPVFSTDRLYVYATDDYFLLWENSTLLTAIPRWDKSYVSLDWSDELVFHSWGNNGNTRWHSPRPYPPSYCTLRTGDTPIETLRDLNKLIVGFGKIAGNNFHDWGNSYKSSGATIEWNPYVLKPQIET